MDKNMTKKLLGDIKEYSFQSFAPIPEGSDKASVYSFESFDEGKLFKKKEHQQVIKLERNHAEKNNFLIAPIVKEHRGLQEQEEVEYERRILDEVAKRVSLIEKEAFRRGHEDGVKSGRDEVYEQTRAGTEEKLASLTSMISNVLKVKGELLLNQKKEVYKMVRNLTKWIILRELKDDDNYLERLLEKLIVEAQTKSNLLVQVNQKEFENMEEVLEHIQERLGVLPNIRVEVDYDIEGTGIVLETDNGIVNGTLEEQFKSLDRLFAIVGLDTDDNSILDKMSIQEETSSLELREKKVEDLAALENEMPIIVDDVEADIKDVKKDDDSNEDND